MQCVWFSSGTQLHKGMMVDGNRNLHSPRSLSTAQGTAFPEQECIMLDQTGKDVAYWISWKNTQVRLWKLRLPCNVLLLGN